MTRRTDRFEGRIERTVARSEPWWPPEPNEGARRPNVVVILVDDMGFSDVACYGSEIPTPAIDAIAERGVRFTDFHVTPLCSPTRASLLTGLSHHRAGFAFVANVDSGFPNRSAAFPVDCLTLPEILRDSGYGTYAVGKWHLTPEHDMHDAGSREMWPCQVGFDRYYGFLEAFTVPFAPPRLIRDNTPVEVDTYPEGYFVTDDLTDRAVEMIKAHRAADPDKPFFLYFGHAAVHGPHQAPEEDVQPFADTYSAGWDEIAAARFARQKELGLFAPDTPIADRSSDERRPVPAWDDIDDDRREVLARMMAVYAGMIRGVDRSTARIVAELERLGELDDTIILFLSDNGATGEGGDLGTVQYLKHPPMQVSGEDRVSLPVGELGGPRSMIDYARGWAMASNTPLRLYKGSLHEGGVRSPLVVAGPGVGVGVGDGISRGFRHVTDLAPTILDLVGVTAPAQCRGLARLPFDGESFASALAPEGAAAARGPQHDEMMGHRSSYDGDWKAVTQHARLTDFETDTWELYALSDDPGETADLAADHPERVSELRTAWERAAAASGVFPLDEGSGLAQAMRDPASDRFTRPVRLLPGTPTVERFRASFLTQWRSFTVSIDFHCTAEDEGVLVAHGGQGGGYAVYLEDHRLHLAVNEYGNPLLAATPPLTPGDHVATLTMTVGAARECAARLEVDGQSVTIDGFLAFVAFAPAEGIDVGIDRRSPVSWDMHERHGAFPYTGALHAVTYTPGPLAPDAPETRIAQMRAAGLRFQ